MTVKRRDPTETSQIEASLEARRKRSYAFGVPIVGTPVPRREFDFDQPTPVSMTHETYHALRTIRDGQEQNDQITLAVLNMMTAREEREAKARESEKKQRWVIAVIGAVAAAVGAIIAAVKGLGG